MKHDYLNYESSTEEILKTINWLLKQERYADCKFRWYDKEIEKLKPPNVRIGSPEEEKQWDPEKCKAYATIFLANAKRGKDNLKYQKFNYTRELGRDLQELGWLFAHSMEDCLHDLAYAAFYGKERELQTKGLGLNPYTFPGMKEQRPQATGFFPNDWIFLYKEPRALSFHEFNPGFWRLEGRFRLQYIGDQGRDYSDVLY